MLLACVYIRRNRAPLVSFSRTLNLRSNFNALDTYVDCESRSIESLRQTFERDGIVMFTPCSLMRNSTLLVEARDFVCHLCPGERLDTGCMNRIVKADNSAVMQLAIDQEILLVLSLLYRGRSPFPFQTLNFKFGTGQPMHSDLIHFAGYPSLTMTAAWIALEDVLDDSGPLAYFLGSHREPLQTMSALSCPLGQYRSCYEEALANYISNNEHKWKKSHMLPRRGQVVIWDSNLIHGGGYVRNEALTRLSQVTHYFFDDDSFFFQPKLSESSKSGQFIKFSMRRDVATDLSANDIINRHWKSTHPAYTSHYETYFSENLHDVHMQDLHVPAATLT